MSRNPRKWRRPGPQLRPCYGDRRHMRSARHHPADLFPLRLCKNHRGAALLHQWGAWVQTLTPPVPPAGRTRTCSRCGNTKTQALVPGPSVWRLRRVTPHLHPCRPERAHLRPRPGGPGPGPVAPSAGAWQGQAPTRTGRAEVRVRHRTYQENRSKALGHKSDEQWYTCAAPPQAAACRLPPALCGRMPAPAILRPAPSAMRMPWPGRARQHAERWLLASPTA